MTFTKFVAGTKAKAAETNANLNALTQRALINLINTHKLDVTSGYTLTPVYRGVVQLIDTDVANTKTNWTWVASTKQYENTQTSAATLQFNDVLSAIQKNECPVIQEAAAWIVFDDAGSESNGILANRGFETAGGGGADVFGSWTESLTQPSGGSVAFTQPTTGSGITESTHCASWSGSTTSTTPTGASGSLTQTIDVTGYKYVSVDYYLAIQQTGGAALNDTITLTLSVGAATTNVSLSTGGDASAHTASGTLVLDVTTVTGNQTLTLAQSSGNSAGARTYVIDCRMDNVRAVKGGDTSGNLSRTISLSADGTNFVTVNNGEWCKFTNTGSNLCVKIVETRSDGSTVLKDVVQELAVLYES